MYAGANLGIYQAFRGGGVKPAAEWSAAVITPIHNHLLVSVESHQTATTCLGFHFS
jgi:hypothetical protein